jgi:secreted PhoX family phosphatase
MLRTALVGAGTAAFAGALWEAAFADTAQPGRGPYGELMPVDANAIRLPAGFTSRVIGRSRQVVAGTSYRWHDAPDGGACFEDDEDGWIYVSNSEIALAGGASAVRFRADASIASAYRILSGTQINCAGGATPWGTWLSCEEYPLGVVYETDPRGERPAVARTRMGRFTHEAAACDPDRRVVYLTEDEPDGGFYRFRPDAWSAEGWGNLDTGTLEVLVSSADTGVSSADTGRVSWARIPDRDGFPLPTRYQVRGARRFAGGEGCHYAGGVCYFTTKGDNRVWAYDAVNSRLDLAYDDSLIPDGAAPLTGVDNITGTRGGDLYVAEDGGNMEINMITPAGVVAPFLRITGHGASEITGPAFSPNGQRLYFSSQRGTSGDSGGGITYEVTGPFRG